MAVHEVENFIRFNYHSAWGSHTMDRPTTPWVGTPWLNAGEYVNWSDNAVAADTMAVAFATLLRPFLLPEGGIDGYTIYAAPAPGEKPLPVWADNLNLAGTSTSESQDRAWGKVFTLRDTGSNLVRLEILDTPCEGNAIKVNTISGADLAIVNELIDENLAWMSRADMRPIFFLSLVTDTNEALLRKYGIS